jgi:hypothetical protein
LHYLANHDPAATAITCAVEGDTDAAVLTRLIEEVGCSRGQIYGRRGKEFLRSRISRYNSAAKFSPWVVLVDLDEIHDCAPALRGQWLPEPAQMMCFRVAVREVESWLLADAERFAAFFGVRRGLVPQDAENLMRPKEALVNLARNSRRRPIREGLVPRPGSGRTVGPAYSSWLIEYAQDPAEGWRPSVAARNSRSLRACLACIRALAGRVAI